MKRVGIVTMHRPLNVGCTLQAYATCEIMRQLGAMPEIIDYYYPNELHKQNGAISRLLHFANMLAGFFITGMEFQRRKRRFDEFISKYLPLSSPYYTYDQLKRTPPDYDIYCAGSDQIWNPAFIQEDDTFLCGFVANGKKKISYASSFGVSSISDGQRSFYSEYLHGFSFVSAREQKGVAMLKREIGVDATRVLDPTLLLDAAFWARIAREDSTRRVTRPSIVIYGASTPDGELERTARRLASQYDWDIIRIHGRPWQKWTPGMNYLFDIGPAEFLECIKEAKCVLTSTFHGTAFAVNFGVPFYSFISANSDDTRIMDLLSLLELDGRIMFWGQGRNIERIVPLGEQYIERLNQEKKESIVFLRRALD